MTESTQTNTYMESDLLFPAEPHLALVFLLDTSKSMVGTPISRLNKAINYFIEQFSSVKLAQIIDVAIIEFNDTAHVLQKFKPFSQLHPIVLTAKGRTAMGEGINLAIDEVKKRSRFYSNMGTPCFMPWILMFSAGMPTDDISVARQRIIDEENRGNHGKLKFWAVGVPGYSKDVLSSLTKRCIAIENFNFESVFDWMRESIIGGLAIEKVGEKPLLPNFPDNLHIVPQDW